MISILVPYKDRDLVKQLGAVFDWNDECWKIEDTPSNQQLFKRWIKNKEIFLYVPYHEREDAKKLGAVWDSEKNMWKTYTSDAINSPDLLKWEIHYIDIPFSEKDKYKDLGAKWDVDKKRWYVNKKIYQTILKELL